MSSWTLKKINVALAKTFCIIWAIWIIFEYCVFHPIVVKAILELPYWPLLLAYLTIYILYLILRKFRIRDKSSNDTSIKIRGISIFLIFQLFAVLTLSCYVVNNRIPDFSWLSGLGYFAFLSTFLLVAIIFIIAIAFVIGMPFIRLIHPIVLKGKNAIAIGIGFSLVGVALVILGLFGAINFYLCWTILIIVAIFGRRDLMHFFEMLFIKKWSVDFSPMILAVVLILMGVSSINWIGSIKPYPIGFDGSNLYVNLAHLISESSSLPSGGLAYNWSVIMSLGETLFNNVSISILLSHSMSFLCLICVYFIASFWLNKINSLLAATVAFVSPYFAFHSFVDEKIDLGLLFICLCALLLILNFLEYSKGQKFKETIKLNYKWRISTSSYFWILCGWLCGFAFGIKYTALFVIIGLLAILFSSVGQRLRSFWGFTSLSMGIIFVSGFYEMAYIELIPFDARWMGLIFMFIGVLLFLNSTRADLSLLRQPLGLSMKFCLTALLAFSPWMIKHSAENMSTTPASLLEGRSSTPFIEVDDIFLPKDKHGFHLHKINQSPNHSKPPLPSSRFISKNENDQVREERRQRRKQLALRKQSEEMKTAADKKGFREEIKRYLGFEKGPLLYSSLPLDLTMNTNIPNKGYLNLGFLFLALFPLLILNRFGKSNKLLPNIISFIALIAWHVSSYSTFFSLGPEYSLKEALLKSNEQILSLHSKDSSLLKIYDHCLNGVNAFTEVYRSIFNWLSGVNTFWTLIIAFFGIICIADLIKHNYKSSTSSFKAFLLFIVGTSAIWFMLGSGIPWYGFPIFVLAPIAILYFIESPDQFLSANLNRFSSVFIKTIVFTQILLFFLTYFHSSFDKSNSKNIFLWPFVYHMTNPTSTQGKVLKHFNFSNTVALLHLNSNLSDKIYKIGSYLHYHIKENDTRVYIDNVLEKFNEITSKTREDEKFIDVLKHNGFKYIIYDLGTPVLDKTPEKGLRRKCKRLVDVLINSNKVELVATDNFVYDSESPEISLPNGQRIKGKLGMSDNNAYAGTFAVYRIN